MIDKGTEITITAPTLEELIDKLDAATPAGKVAVVQGSLEVTKGDPLVKEIWKVTYKLRDRI